MAIRVWGGGGWMNHYTNKENLIEKVLDFDQLGGPERTVLRTFRWEVLL